MVEEEAISKYSSNVKTCKGLGPSNSEELSMESQILLISKKERCFGLFCGKSWTGCCLDRNDPWTKNKNYYALGCSIVEKRCDCRIWS
jgi:hypothetical protein